jgi:hypothetical protein
MCTWASQTYDGELVWSGVRKLLCQRRAINPQQLQVLKKKECVFSALLFNYSTLSL